MKLGLLHVVGKKKATARKATAKKQPAVLAYEHKSLQDFGASKFVTQRLETSNNMKVSLDLVVKLPGSEINIIFFHFKVSVFLTF